MSKAATRMVARVTALVRRGRLQEWRIDRPLEPDKYSADGLAVQGEAELEAIDRLTRYLVGHVGAAARRAGYIGDPGDPFPTSAELTALREKFPHPDVQSFLVLPIEVDGSISVSTRVTPLTGVETKDILTRVGEAAELGGLLLLLHALEARRQDLAAANPIP